jgi:hypothetical protein
VNDQGERDRGREGWRRGGERITELDRIGEER